MITEPVELKHQTAGNEQMDLEKSKERKSLIIRATIETSKEHRKKQDKDMQTSRLHFWLEVGIFWFSPIYIFPLPSFHFFSLPRLNNYYVGLRLLKRLQQSSFVYQVTVRSQYFVHH